MRFALVFVLVFAAVPETALAESALPSCVPGTWYPEATHVPTNLPGFVFRSDNASATPGSLSLIRYRDESAMSEPVTIVAAAVTTGLFREWIVTLDGPLEEGWTYVFSDSSCSIRETTFFVDPAVSLPETLGVTHASELRSQRNGPYESLRYFVEVRLELAPELVGLEALMRMRLAIDGEASPSLDSERLYTLPYELAVACLDSSSTLLREGMHELQHRAAFHASADPELLSSGATVDVRCDGAVRVRPGTNVPLTDAEIAEADRLPDGTLVPPEGAPLPPPSGMSGGGCRVSPGPARGGLAIVALLLGLALRRFTDRSGYGCER